MFFFREIKKPGCIFEELIADANILIQPFTIAHFINHLEISNGFF